MVSEEGESLAPKEMEVGGLTVATGGNTVAFTTNNAPSGVGSSAIGKWLEVLVDGVKYYIPMWT